MRFAWLTERPLWRAAGRYVLVTLLLNLAGEIVQAPLYTLWWTEPLRAVALALLHCTAGDGLIAGASLLLAIALVGRGWPDRWLSPVTAATIALAVAYTLFSEYVNVYVRHSWAYTAAMPLLPVFGVGLAPLAQWIVIPAASLAWVARRKRRITEAPSGERGLHVGT